MDDPIEFEYLATRLYALAHDLTVVRTGMMKVRLIDEMKALLFDIRQVVDEGV